MIGCVKSTAKHKVKQIALHEIGHALGLGHANFVGDIMAPAPKINDPVQLLGPHNQR